MDFDCLDSPEKKGLILFLLVILVMVFVCYVTFQWKDKCEQDDKIQCYTCLVDHGFTRNTSHYERAIHCPICYEWDGKEPCPGCGFPEERFPI